MSRRKIILSIIVAFSITVFAGQNPSEKSKSDVPEYPQDFERQQQKIPQENPNTLRERAAQRRAIRQRFGPDFARLQGLMPEQRIREMQKMAQEQEEQAMKQALGVNEAQWKIIEPKLNKVKACRERASVSIGPPFSSNFVSSSGSPQGQSFGGNFQFQIGGAGNMMAPGSSFQNQSDRRQTKGEKICQELYALLENMNSPPEAIRRKMIELQQARASARKQLAQAQKELREALTLHQQARLVLMGIID